MAAVNTVGWLEIGTDDPAAAERFYGDIFGWTFDDDPATDDYRTISAPGAGLQGGVFATGGQTPGYAIFYLTVADVEDTVRRAEAAGGKVLVAPQQNKNGLTFAHLLDPSGNHFGVFSPPSR
jgi:predicted enzyme related to lactoylglutathione lyase